MRDVHTPHKSGYPLDFRLSKPLVRLVRPLRPTTQTLSIHHRTRAMKGSARFRAACLERRWSRWDVTLLRTVGGLAHNTHMLGGWYTVVVPR